MHRPARRHHTPPLRAPPRTWPRPRLPSARPAPPALPPASRPPRAPPPAVRGLPPVGRVGGRGRARCCGGCLGLPSPIIPARVMLTARLMSGRWPAGLPSLWVRSGFALGSLCVGVVGLGFGISPGAILMAATGAGPGVRRRLLEC